MKLIFWQNIISPHQVDLLTTLALQGDDITLIVEKEIDKFRADGNWSLNTPSNIKLIVSPNDEVIRESLDIDSIHIFTGFFSYPLITKAFKLACKKKLRIYLYSEYVDWSSFKGKLKLLYKKAIMYLYRKNIEGVLATGERSCEYFKLLGLKESKVYEFGYFINSKSNVVLEVENDVNQIIFVGRLVECKGIFNAITAFAQALKEDSNLFLKIIGDGPLRNELELYVKKRNLNGYVEFTGSVDNGLALAEIEKSSLLVLPNIGKEGWGVVVNEALLAGTPVVCTKYTGANCLLMNGIVGKVIEASDIFELKKTILNAHNFNKEEIKTLSHNMIGTHIVAHYLKDIITIKNVKPTPPWRNK